MICSWTDIPQVFELNSKITDITCKHLKVNCCNTFLCLKALKETLENTDVNYLLKTLVKLLWTSLCHSQFALVLWWWLIILLKCITRILVSGHFQICLKVKERVLKQTKQTRRKWDNVQKVIIRWDEFATCDIRVSLFIIAFNQ